MFKLNIYLHTNNACMLQDFNRNLINIWIIVTEHLNPHQFQGVICAEKCTNSQDKLSSKISELRKKTVEQEGECQAAHRDSNACNDDISYQKKNNYVVRNAGCARSRYTLKLSLIF